eukprot:298228-Hanusia_phi.AAC.4
MHVNGALTERKPPSENLLDALLPAFPVGSAERHGVREDKESEHLQASAVLGDHTDRVHCQTRNQYGTGEHGVALSLDNSCGSESVRRFIF